MAYGTVNADVIQTSTTGGILGAGNASIMKNRIINGAMVIDQRNAGASGTANAYTVDRWGYYGTQSSKGTWQQNAGSVTAPVGFSNYLGFTSSSAYSVTSTDNFVFYQSIEGFNFADLGFGTANAKTITLSFWARSSLTGTFGGVFANFAFSRCYPFTYSIPTANTWTQISVTIAGDTSGTWVGATNAGAATLQFGLGTGSTYSGTAGAWSSTNYQSATGATSVVGTSGATFYITGVQLEVGSSATGFEYVNYQTSLANCQRYYAKLNNDGVGDGFIAIGGQISTTSGWFVINNPVTMRAEPTVTFSSINVTDSIAWATSATLTSTNAAYNATQVTCSMAANGAQYRPVALTINTNTTGFVSLSSEL